MLIWSGVKVLPQLLPNFLDYTLFLHLLSLSLSPASEHMSLVLKIRALDTSLLASTSLSRLLASTTSTAPADEAILLCLSLHFSQLFSLLLHYEKSWKDNKRLSQQLVHVHTFFPGRSLEQ